MSERQSLVVAYGGGVNSTAMLLGMVEKAIRPDAILFADTGGEKPETYDYVRGFGAVLLARGFPCITVVQNDGTQPTLEQCCLENKQLPAIVYGRRACSDKYKQRPQHKWVKRWQPAIDCWARGEKVRKAVGFDADERHRATIKEDDFYQHWYPLIEWGWTRADCGAAIYRHGLACPPKSACFFCPSSTKREVLALAEQHPDLMGRAIAMEVAARPNLESVKGLGRRWSWENLVNHDRSLPMLFDDPQDFGCLCSTEINAGDEIDAA